MEVPYPKDIKSISNALFIEHHVQRIITQQEENGVRFDIRRAQFYIHVLREKQLRLYNKIRPRLSLEVRAPYDRPVSKPFLKTGGYSNGVTNWYTGDIPDVSGPFTRVEFNNPDLGSRIKLIAQLLRLGWKPAHFTEKGSPKLTWEGSPCKSLESIDTEVGQLISLWYRYRHRESQIKGLINLSLIHI